MSDDAYETCRFVQRYFAKNGYLPARSMLGSDEYVDALVRNGVIELLPLYESGPLIKAALTDKGRRMASERR